MHGQYRPQKLMCNILRATGKLGKKITLQEAQRSNSCAQSLLSKVEVLEAQ